jgi:hypothetical protein
MHLLRLPFKEDIRVPEEDPGHVGCQAGGGVAPCPAPPALSYLGMGEGDSELVVRC